MTKFFAIILLSYHLFGTMCLPMSDFSVIADLPKMYQHCKATEDADLDIFDFVTDHLMDFDTVFDIHEQGEKPHQSNAVSHSIQQVNFVAPFFSFICSEIKITENILPVFISNFISTDFLASVFRPPIL